MLSSAPLAERVRPKSLDEYIGQKHIIGEGKAIVQRHKIWSITFHDILGTTRGWQNHARPTLFRKS